MELVEAKRTEITILRVVAANCSLACPMIADLGPGDEERPELVGAWSREVEAQLRDSNLPRLAWPSYQGLRVPGSGTASVLS